MIGAPFVLSWRNITEPAVAAMRVYHPSVHEKISLRASYRVWKRYRSNTSASRLEKNDSIIALSKQSPATHGARDSELPAARGEGHSGIFRAVVRVMDDLIGTALRIGHLQRRQHEVTAQPGIHCPPDDVAREHIQHDRQVQPPLVGGHVGLQSASHSAFGRSAVKCLCTRSGA